MHTLLTAIEINRLAQRLSETPLGRSASAGNAADRLRRLLAVKIGEARADAATFAILAAPGFETAEGRLITEIEADEPEMAALPSEPVVETALEEVADLAPANQTAPEPASAGPVRRRRGADLEANARQGELPPPPDFSAPTHARFRAKLEGLVALAMKGDAEALKAVAINPVSSSPKALARYRDLCVIAIAASMGAAA